MHERDRFMDERANGERGPYLVGRRRWVTAVMVGDERWSHIERAVIEAPMGVRLMKPGCGNRRTGVENLGRTVAALGVSVMIGFAGTAHGQAGALTGSSLRYLGAFRLECSGDWCSYNLNGLGVAPNGGLWVTDHVYDYAVRRVEIPAVFSTSQVFDDLPEAATVEGPVATAGCPGTATELNGVSAIGTDAATTCRDYYNVGGVYQAVYRRRPAAAVEEVGPQTLPFHPNKYGAYLFTLPTDWAAAQGLGSRTAVTGFSREAGAFGGSQGPTLFAFDPDNPADAVDLLWYREIYPGCPGAGNCDFPGYESADSWMGADWVRSGADDAVLIAGVKAGSTCYGSGSACGDPCRASQGYHGYPYTAKVLFYDPGDLEARLAGTLQPYEVLPYDEWMPGELWAQQCPDLGGLAFDDVTGRLYIAERLAGPFGEGIIHVYQLDRVGLIFADGFESGNTSAWSN